MIDEKINILTNTYHIHKLPPQKVELDLGCGKGKFTVELADKYREAHVIAADIMIGRLRKVAKKADRLNLSNIEILRVEATALMGYILQDNSVDRLHILCPDPWPKTKHKGHRLLSSQFLRSVTRVLKVKGIFHFSTDNEAYYESVTRLVETSGLFSPANPELIADIADIKTDFQLRWEEQKLEVRHIAWKVIK